MGAFSSPGLAVCRNCSTSRRRSGDGLEPASDEPGDARRVANDVPGIVVDLAANQQVAGEHLLLDDLLAVVLELDHILDGDRHLVDATLHVHRVDAGLEVLLDLVLVARLGVDDIPLAGPVVGADLLLDLGGLLLEEVFGVDGFDIAHARSSVGPAPDDTASCDPDCDAAHR